MEAKRPDNQPDDLPANLPELTSFGTLFKFALALEGVAAQQAEQAAANPACAARRDQLAVCARKHAKRVRELERLRRERLNEVVLQPISGMERARYLPPTDLPEGGEEIVNQIAALEEMVARFHDDAAEIAANVLTGMDRKLRKLAEESRKLAAGLR